MANITNLRITAQIQIIANVRFDFSGSEMTYNVFSLLSPPGAYSFQALLRGGGLSGEGGGLFETGGLIYSLRKLYDNFPPTRRNVCKTTMHVF